MGGVVSKNFFFSCVHLLCISFFFCVLVQPNSAHTEPYNLRLVVLLLFGQVTIWNRATISSRGPQKLFFHNKQQSLLVKREEEKKKSLTIVGALKKKFRLQHLDKAGNGTNKKTNKNLLRKLY